MTDKKVKVALLQTTCCDSPQDNLKHTAELIATAAKGGAQIICTQELYRSKYFCHSEDPALFDLAETIPGPSTDRFSALAKQHGVVIVASLFEKRGTGLYHNTAVVIDADGTIVGKYRKMHIPDDPGYYEKYYFTPGDLGFKAFDTRFGRVGVCVCWDQWFPESARLTALDGAQILFYPTAIGWSDEESKELHVAQHDAWETIQRSHAIANGVYLAAVNRIGREGDNVFWGQSFAADPFGRMIERASSDKEEIVYFDADFSEVEQQRRLWPFLRDRRIEHYGDMCKLAREEE